MEAIYLNAGSEGWGQVPANHPHQIAKSSFDACRIVLSRFLAEDIDIVVVHGYRKPYCALGIMLARLSGKQVIVRGDANIDALVQDPRRVKIIRRLLGRILIPRSSIAWTIGTKNGLAWSQELGISQQVRIPFEVSISPADPTPSQGRSSHQAGILKVLFIGRLIRVKGVDLAIAALKALPAEYQWEFHIVGDGPERGRLEDLASGDDRIVFHGRMEHRKLTEILSLSDVLVVPSTYEPWGVVVNEALSVGVRVLASDSVGAGADLITPENGGIFASGSEQELTQLLIGSYGLPRPVALEQPDTALMALQSISEIRNKRAARKRNRGSRIRAALAEGRPSVLRK